MSEESSRSGQRMLALADDGSEGDPRRFLDRGGY